MEQKKKKARAESKSNGSDQNKQAGRKGRRKNMVWEQTKSF